MLDLLTGFVAELRAAGIPVSLTEHLDAAEALTHVPMEDREAIKYTLGASLVKSSSHWRAYETAFEIYFSLRGPEYRIDGDDDDPAAGSELETDGMTGSGNRRGQGRGGGGGGQEGMTPEELADLLYKALLGANDAMGPPWPGRRCPATRGWRRAGRSGGPTTSTGRCGTSTSTGCSTG